MNATDWEIIDETAAEVEMQGLLYALVRMLKPALVVETGTYLGYSTRALGRACQENGQGRVVSCDPNPEYVSAARIRCSGLPVEIHCCPSAELPEFEQADFIFSDSDYGFRPAELASAKRGAIVVVHDTRISYDSTMPPLEGLVRQLGGLAFATYRGFGLVVKEG